MNLDRLLTARQAAGVLGVPVGTVRTWYERGTLPTVGNTSTRGRANLYRLGDLLRAESLARQSDPARRRASALVRAAQREAQ